jgi:phospholipid/cholesterol/gamma-HCH transport system substrate-binding protein
MKIRKEFIIGVIASFTLIAFYWGFSFLKGDDIFSKEREFVLVYDKVAGLSVSNPVNINGLNVGKVSYVGFIPNDSNARILVKIKLTNNIDIPKNTLAVIKSDLLGVNSIDLKFKPSSSFAKSGDTLNTAIATTIQEEVSMQMLPIKLKAEDMMASLDSVLGAIRYIFNKETQQHLAQTFESIQTTINNLEHTSYGLDTIVSGQTSNLKAIFADIKSITGTLNENTAEIDNIITNFSDISDSLSAVDLKATLDRVDGALLGFQEIVDKVNSGEGSMGKLVNNDSLYFELEGASRELNQLLEDIKLNPKRYVRVSVFGGKNNDPYISPEDKAAKEKK